MYKSAEVYNLEVSTIWMRCVQNYKSEEVSVQCGAGVYTSGETVQIGGVCTIRKRVYNSAETESIQRRWVQFGGGVYNSEEVSVLWRGQSAYLR